MYIFICMYFRFMYIYMYKYINIYIFTYLHVYMYIYVYVYLDTHEKNAIRSMLYYTDVSKLFPATNVATCMQVQSTETLAQCARREVCVGGLPSRLHT